jgi:Derlin-2/3
MGNVENAGVGASAWYQSLPPVTRTYATVVFLTTCATALGLVNPRSLILYWPLVFGKYQVWRILTTFFFIGGFSFPFVIKMIWIVNYGGALERSKYSFNEVPTYLFLMLFSATSLVLISLLIKPLGLMLLADPFIFTLIYIWSKSFPTERVSILGLFQVQAFYLPFAFAGITVIMGGSPIPDIVGIVVGHVFYYLMEIYPFQYNRRLIQTPQFLRTLSIQLGLLERPMPSTGVSQGFRAFRGSGRRLAD